MPEESILNDIRLETRERVTDYSPAERKDIITLLGIAPSDASISTYIEALSASTYFTNISLMYAQQEGHTTKRKQYTNSRLELYIRSHPT